VSSPTYGSRGPATAAGDRVFVTGRVRIAPEVVARHPDYQAMVLRVRHLANGPSTPQSIGMLEKSVERAAQKFAAKPLEEHPHLAAWRRKYASFGCNPRRIFCSAEALLRRALKKGLPLINRVVDVYNAVSLEHVIPIGGEDIDSVQGNVVLRFATGMEDFLSNDRGGIALTHPDPAEVIWTDDGGVTCRRWNWRQCSRTALTVQSTTAYFLPETVAPFGIDQLKAATKALCDALRRVSPECEFAEEDLPVLEPARATA